MPGNLKCEQERRGTNEGQRLKRGVNEKRQGQSLERGKKSFECEMENLKFCFVSVQVCEYSSITTKCSSFANLCHPP